MTNEEIKEPKEVAGTNQKQEKIQMTKEDYAAAIKEQVEQILKQREEESKGSLERRIEEEIEKRLVERKQSERERIEEARRMIEEADRNAALEQELISNDRYNRISDWKKNKIKEFEREVDILAQMGHMNKHEEGFYKKYSKYSLQAARQDRRAQDALGIYNLTYAAMKLGGKGLRDALFRNMGVYESIE